MLMYPEASGVWNRKTSPRDSNQNKQQKKPLSYPAAFRDLQGVMCRRGWVKCKGGRCGKGNKEGSKCSDSGELACAVRDKPEKQLSALWQRVRERAASKQMLLWKLLCPFLFAVAVVCTKVLQAEVWIQPLGLKHQGCEETLQGLPPVCLSEPPQPTFGSTNVLWVRKLTFKWHSWSSRHVGHPRDLQEHTNRTMHFSNGAFLL